jgi:predicted alpha-1,2-mannosidase
VAVGLLLGTYLLLTFPVSPKKAIGQQGDLTRFVNPFIGTSANGLFGGGDTFPGAATPMGMVQWSPDTPSNPPGGYSYDDSHIKDFSLTHFSGRGCQVYQDFAFMPYVGKVSVSPATHPSHYYSSYTHNLELARPGFYQVQLDTTKVEVQLSATPHTGIGLFGFPNSSESTMIINAAGSVNGAVNSGVNILPGNDEVTGSVESTVGCGSNHYTVYFAARFNRAFAGFGTWSEDVIKNGSTAAGGQHTGAFVVFDTRANGTVVVQTGVSFVSVANAQLNLDSEFQNFELAAAAQKADASWNSTLSSIEVLGGTHDELVSFYTALYHVFFHPNIFNDVNGEYIGFDGRVHVVPSGHVQYENIPGWDQYRTHTSLIAILRPDVASDVAQSLVNDAQQGDGHLPRWEQANQDSHGMSGDSGDVIIAEAYAFGATNFDAGGALKAMLQGQPQIREGLLDYLKLGYVPSSIGIPTASITLEYSVDDFAIAQFAHALGDQSDYATYLKRSANWQNVFNTSSGYVQLRNANGTWTKNFSPTSDNGFSEGDSAQYTWLVPYNVEGLLNKMGGNSAAVSRLDAFFTELNAGPGSPHAWMGNEPSVEVPWEYDFVQAPSHTQDVVRRIETQLWSNTPTGIPGNDDAGEMSAWYVFAAMGLYPEVTAVGGFVVGSPLFRSITVHLSGGYTLQINAPRASDGNLYVQSLQLNGNPTTSVWLSWNVVGSGATLDFQVTGSPNTWGSAAQDAPPSYAAAP